MIIFNSWTVKLVAFLLFLQLSAVANDVNLTPKNEYLLRQKDLHEKYHKHLIIDVYDSANNYLTVVFLNDKFVFTELRDGKLKISGSVECSMSNDLQNLILQSDGIFSLSEKDKEIMDRGRDGIGITIRRGNNSAFYWSPYYLYLVSKNEKFKDAWTDIDISVMARFNFELAKFFPILSQNISSCLNKTYKVNWNFEKEGKPQP
ncbi:hypothetical protein SAMN02745181_0693 [Rubritalea squalenifaciens DSM 18772]|uniref:Secreted protein n=1 Tax=Rubritalea squalenifaciens DSM 18772 TaxID=1123071 RepID=A0A1M6DBF9_9BACT|nr:hypothetical protein [Rubritalea squalenifaciens]SHI70509.1 hypothetical protein SAMN02745181_0693 [Rubritalea squalenifaciens DSM 18772]